MKNSVVEISAEIHPIPSSPKKNLRPILVKSRLKSVDRHQQTTSEGNTVIVPALKLDSTGSSSPKGLNEVLPWQETCLPIKLENADAKTLNARKILHR